MCWDHRFLPHCNWPLPLSHFTLFPWCQSCILHGRLESTNSKLQLSMVCRDIFRSAKDPCAELWGYLFSCSLFCNFCVACFLEPFFGGIKLGLGCLILGQEYLFLCHWLHHACSCVSSIFLLANLILHLGMHYHIFHGPHIVVSSALTFFFTWVWK